jgi:hypothetical protein
MQTDMRSSLQAAQDACCIAPVQVEPADAHVASTRHSRGGTRSGPSVMRKIAMRAAVAGLALCSWDTTGTAQTEGLRKGLYVIDRYPCDDFPPPAAFIFDGRSFNYKTVACKLKKNASTSGDSYIAICSESSNPSASEEQNWEFRKLTDRSFSIDKSVFRFCAEN